MIRILRLQSLVRALRIPVRMATSLIRQDQVDAFTLQPFGGNPACVVFSLPNDEIWMQKLSNENNVGATVFIEKHLVEVNTYNVRWFTANKELDLCGHGTLAAAHVLYESKQVANNLDRIYFKSMKSGTLSAVGQSDGTIQLDFPSTPSVPCTLSSEDKQKLASAFSIGVEDIIYTGRTPYDLFVELKVGAFGGLGAINYTDLEYFGGRGVIITCRGGGRLSESDEDDVMSRQLNKDNVVWNKQYDFLSRMFLPRFGTNEDWATGSSHCALTPYWLHKFNSELRGSLSDSVGNSVKSLVGYQASARGGTMYVSMTSDTSQSCGGSSSSSSSSSTSSEKSEARVLLAGHCVTTIKSQVLYSPPSPEAAR